MVRLDTLPPINQEDRQPPQDLIGLVELEEDWRAEIVNRADSCFKRRRGPILDDPIVKFHSPRGAPLQQSPLLYIDELANNILKSESEYIKKILQLERTVLQKSVYIPILNIIF